VVPREKLPKRADKTPPNQKSTTLLTKMWSQGEKRLSVLTKTRPTEKSTTLLTKKWSQGQKRPSVLTKTPPPIPTPDSLTPGADQKLAGPERPGQRRI